MPTRDIRDAQGRLIRYVRLPYNPKAYTTPDYILDELRSPGPFGLEDDLEEWQGLGGWSIHRYFERDGKRWAILVNGDWAIEEEVTRGRRGEINGLPPEEAWHIARERDALRDPPTEVEDVDDK